MSFKDWVKVFAISVVTLTITVMVMMGVMAFIQDVGYSVGRGIGGH